MLKTLPFRQERPFGFLQNSHGNSIILVLPLLIVLVTVVQLSLSQSLNFSHTIKQFNTVSVRDALVSNIQSYASMPATLRSSLDPSLPSHTNIDLQNCIFGSSPSSCQAKVEHPVTLYSPVSNSVIISGATNDSAATAFYDNKGNLCSGSNNSVDACPFQVTSSFIATCPGDAASCSVAESIVVRFTVEKISTGSSATMATLRRTIQQSATPILVTLILPSSYDSSSQNVTISSLTTVTQEPGSEAEIFIAQQKQVLDTIKSIPDLNLSEEKLKQLVTAITKADLKNPDDIKFFAEVGISDHNWITMVKESGVTDKYYAYELYYGDFWEAKDIRAAYDAVKNLNKDPVAVTIAINKINDPGQAKHIYDNVANIPDKEVASGIVTGKWYDDPVKLEAIVKTVEGMHSETAGAIAQLGVTDTVLAKNLQSLVSGIPNKQWGAELIVKGGGDIAKTQDLVNAALAEMAAEDTKPATSTAGTDPNSSSTTTTTTSGSGGPAAPSTLSLISTCTTCSGVSF